jgi:hypothetical protein
MAFISSPKIECLLRLYTPDLVRSFKNIVQKKRLDTTNGKRPWKALPRRSKGVDKGYLPMSRRDNAISLTPGRRGDLETAVKADNAGET